MKLIKYMGVALAMTAFASCSNEDELNFSSWENDPSAVHIQASVGNGLLARTTPGATNEANQKKFNNGDQISVAAGTQTAVIYTLADGTWTPDGGNYLKWGKTENMDFETYYPATEGTSMTQFTIPTDQSSPEKIAKADYMTFTGNNIAKADKVNLTFERQTARIMVKLNFNSEYAGNTPSVTELKIKGYNQIPNSSTSNLTYFTACIVEGAGVPTYAALVAPNAYPSDKIFFISLKVNDKKYSIKGLPAVEAGKSYTYNLKLGRNRVEVESVSVDNWASDILTITNGEVSPSDITFNVQDHSITTKRAGTITSGLIAIVAGTSKRLKVVGPINGKDIKAIREATGCTYEGGTIEGPATVTDLDLSEASFKASKDVFSNWNGECCIWKDNELNKGMFYNSKLTSIKVPNNITMIGHSAFSASNNLIEINIPKTVTKIDMWAMYNCTSLTTVTFELGGTEALCIDINAFRNAKIENITIPNRTTFIGQEAFSSCTGSTVTFEEGGNLLLGIGQQRAFYKLSATQAIILPSRLNSLDKSTFEKCNIKDLTIKTPWSEEAEKNIQCEGFGNPGNCTLHIDNSWNGKNSGNTLLGTTWKAIEFIGK